MGVGSEATRKVVKLSVVGGYAKPFHRPPPPPPTPPGPSAAPLRVEYIGLDSGPSCFAAVAKRLGIMDNIKANVPRTAYYGVVEYKRGRNTVFVTPPLEEIDWNRV